MSRIRLLGIFLPALMTSVVLGACRDSEQGRVSNFEPGVYKGKTEAPLGADAMKALRVRAYEQSRGFSQTGGGGGGSASVSTSADVRAPASGVNPDLLRARARSQGN